MPPRFVKRAHCSWETLRGDTHVTYQNSSMWFVPKLRAVLLVLSVPLDSPRFRSLPSITPLSNVPGWAHTCFSCLSKTAQKFWGWTFAARAGSRGASPTSRCRAQRSTMTSHFDLKCENLTRVSAMTRTGGGLSVAELSPLLVSSANVNSNPRA